MIVIVINDTPVQQIATDIAKGVVGVSLQGCHIGVAWCQLVSKGVKGCHFKGVKWCHRVSFGVIGCHTGVVTVSLFSTPM